MQHYLFFALIFSALLSGTAHSTESLVTEKYLPELTPSIEKKLRPHLIPNNHPLKASLDRIFSVARVTLNENSFRSAGFDIFSIRPRSYVVVARHPMLPGYVIKANLDDNLHKKQNKDSWVWFRDRCIGAKKVRKVINKKKITHFEVPDKYLYCLPKEPAPPFDGFHTRHLVVLLATDMDLVPAKENLLAWKTVITKQHLDELFEIISHARGSSYRPDNINYTRRGTFAFIDTEYPDAEPDYDRIRKHLNPEMRRYWDKLIKNGGPN